MDLSAWFSWFLFAHIFGAILAFGPTYTFALIGAMGAREPQHANFGLRVSAAISRSFVYPLAILQGVTGLLLVLSAKIDLLGTHWLLLGITLYVIALVYSLSIQRTTVHELIEKTSAPPPPGASGPPPGVLALVKRAQRGGILLGILVTIIVLLMVVKPTF